MKNSFTFVFGLGRFVKLSVLGFLAFSLVGCSEVLFGRLSEAQVNEVVAALSEGNISANKVRVDDTNWRVEVDKKLIGPSLVYLRDRGLPNVKGATMGEVFKKEGLISSPTEEKARYLFALQEDLASTLKKVDGIVEARVHVAVPSNDPLSSRPIAPTASIFVKHRGSLDLELLSPSLKALVMNSVEGLDFKNITLFSISLDQGKGANVVAASSNLPGLSIAGSALGSSTPPLNWIYPLIIVVGILVQLFWISRYSINHSSKKLKTSLPVLQLDTSDRAAPNGDQLLLERFANETKTQSEIWSSGSLPKHAIFGVKNASKS
jgi:type III secretion protein J